MKCPKCRHFLPNGSSFHELCGWGGEAKADIPCAHAGCSHPAIVIRKIKGSWAQLCKAHDLFHAQQESDEFVRNAGLKTIEEKRAWCRRTLRSVKPTPYEHWLRVSQTPGLTPIAYQMARDFLGKRDREPGQDDEEIAA